MAPERTSFEKITTLLQAFSAVLQALSAIAVPIVVAVVAGNIQQSITKQTTAKDFV